MQNKQQLIATIIFLAFLSIASGADASGVGVYKSQATQDASIDVMAGPVLPLISDKMTLTSEQLVKGMEVPFFGRDLVLSFMPGVWQGEPQISVNESYTDVLPWKLQLVSKVYEISVTGATFSEGRGLDVQLGYHDDDPDYRQIYIFDNVGKSWKAMPSTDSVNRSTVKALIKGTQAKIAVFANPAIMTVGKASWYSYKPGMFCASPDFAKGSKLRVTNVETGKSIEVVVNDWGPERDKHPDRVVDLSKEAFKALSPLSAGVIKVAVSPIELAADRNGRVLGVKEGGIGSQPKLASKAAFILNEENGQVILAKNSTLVMSLASLSKILAVSVYLKYKPDLKAKAVYKDKDAAFNALYASAGESAKVKLKDGDQVLAKDLVYASLVASANNAVESLVRNSGLSREAFIAEMNKTAADWGAKSSHFVEPTGLSPKNVTTAEDYAVITHEAFKNDTIRAATVASAYTIKVANRKAQLKLTNTNQLIRDQAQENLKVDDLGLNGSKTGYLNEAGYCLMTRVKSANGQFIIVTLGAPSRQTSFNEMMDLIKYANLKS